MVATSRCFIYQLRNTMTTSSIYIVLICLCLPAIFGMPYLDASNNLEKIYQNSFLDDTDTSNEIEDFLAEYQRPTHPFQELGQLLDDGFDVDNTDEGYDVNNYDIFDNREDKLVGARAKRLGFSYFPFRYTRQYLLKHQNRILPDLLREAGEYPPVKRRLAFTALRGR
ncbi:uncharacterized protein LOC123559896 [Mercenaria mercenaria]|uniref:uncharacterized protein LOC123559896 n=1 Tax=Mercenaria mercenaria TaxID=6596 RepID=UPI00234EECA7|nr:uncharacterized protein LOC123559896 [Mercenaria mercenaria]XP_053408160.1 uncharacterized protein LOC123559896 [Mercenaria mercenaria]